MSQDSRKVALIGTGMVGMSYAYAMLQRGSCDELVLSDIDKNRARGEAMDLNHGLAFSESSMKIYAGDYRDVRDADIAVICAGAAQKEGESRLDLTERNAAILTDITKNIIASGFEGIFLVATNPVDIMTRVVYKVSGFESGRVIGTGTTLDTARLRYLTGEYFGVDPRNVHAYVMGEHGDSEFVPRSQALIGTKHVTKIIEEYPADFSMEDLVKISGDVRNAAGEIIKAKKATYYGIGMALARITEVILGDRNSILTVSAKLCGEYGREDVFAGVPCVVGRDGIERIISLALTSDELSKFHTSCDILEKMYQSLNLE
ncbi:MAG: L-lactate dehydrogenase [Ruminococcaceae bacterium]|nr:L-lactate dehydrogenase [Oscillospiraceae bacterium]